jgi:hypothetical protein
MFVTAINRQLFSSDDTPVSLMESALEELTEREERVLLLGKPLSRTEFILWSAAILAADL